jgi:hypothetical protein
MFMPARDDLKVPDASYPQMFLRSAIADVR